MERGVLSRILMRLGPGLELVYANTFRVIVNVNAYERNFGVRSCQVNHLSGELKSPGLPRKRGGHGGEVPERFSDLRGCGELKGMRSEASNRFSR